ncbi:YfjI family protein [bacterium]|nr:YfjI family protein [bacterium]
MTPPPPTTAPLSLNADSDNPFPVDALPQEFRSFVVKAGDSLGTDPAMIATPMLAVLASAIGAGVRAKIKPTWFEPSIIWTLLVASSGSKKSPAMAMTVKPLLDEQAAMVAPIKRDHARQAEAARKQGLKAPKRPPLPRLALNDTTPEALMQCLAENSHGVLVYADEMSSVLGGFDRYRSGKGSSVGEYLECYGGSSKIVDRKKGGDLFIRRAAVCMTGTIQPGILDRVLDAGQYQNGLAFRFLISAPRNSPRRFTEDSLPEEATKDFQSTLHRLRRLREKFPAGLDVPLSTEALDLFKDHCDSLGREMDTATEFERSIMSKIEGAAARLALVASVSSLAQDPKTWPPKEVSEDSMKAGIKIARYFLTEALRIHNAHILREQATRSDGVMHILRRANVALTTREIVQKSSRRLQSVDEASCILKPLIKRGEVEELPSEPVRGTGRPRGPRYQIRQTG